jgi:hypothetical protein
VYVLDARTVLRRYRRRDVHRAVVRTHLSAAMARRIPAMIWSVTPPAS